MKFTLNEAQAKTYKSATKTLELIGSNSSIIQDCKDNTEDAQTTLLKDLKAFGDVVLFWNKYYSDKGWSFKYYNATKNMMVDHEGSKATDDTENNGKTMSVYKSLSCKAYGNLDGDLSAIYTWKELKEAANPKSEEQLVEIDVKKVFTNQMKKLSTSQRIEIYRAMNDKLANNIK